MEVTNKQYEEVLYSSKTFKYNISASSSTGKFPIFNRYSSSLQSDDNSIEDDTRQDALSRNREQQQKLQPQQQSAPSFQSSKTYKKQGSMNFSLIQTACSILDDLMLPCLTHEAMEAANDEARDAAPVWTAPMTDDTDVSDVLMNEAPSTQQPRLFRPANSSSNTRMMMLNRNYAWCDDDRRASVANADTLAILDQLDFSMMEDFPSTNTTTPIYWNNQLSGRILIQ